jgi:hypothetical protein
MAEYKGSAKGRPLVLDVPLGSATCFAISKDGDLLTDRDIWDTDPPTTLPLPLTGMYLVKHYYVACFGPKEADRFDATLLGVSPRIDLAAFRVDHHFLEPFRFADPPTKLGDEVYAAGFPGEILNFLDDANGSTTSEKEQLGQALNSDSGRADLLDAYFLNWSYSLLNKGMVSAIGHIIDDVDYTEFDIQVSQGENGGPLLNTQFQIAGMVTFNKTDPSDTSPPTGRAISSWELQRAVSTLIPGQIR